MAKKTARGFYMGKHKIPKMDVVITTRNAREENAAGIFISCMKHYARSAAEGHKPSLEIVDKYAGCTSIFVHEMQGMASMFYFMDMIDNPISTVEIADAIRAMYLDEIGEQEATA